MRKSVFLTAVLSLCFAQTGTFAAVATRGGRGTGNANAVQQQTTQNAAQPVAARAATRQKVANNAASVAVSGNVAARAGKKQTVQNTVKPSAGSPMAARAGSTQKVINTGTKVAAATENTAVPQECQEAFYGCMDAFCMLDNASGGRCQCNDRVLELDKVLEDIVKLDEQSYIMATEGVERIQMGEGEDQIMARAKAAGDKAVDANKEKEKNKQKARTLDLSAWQNSIFSDVDDLFGANEDGGLETFIDKKGDDLYKSAAKMCASQITEKCKSYSSMMQLVYAQKIKSDCVAYENSLKAQKNQSQQKLQTAQKALRDAALDEYKNQNKYATAGECVVEFTRCMQTTAECGTDYTGCVTLAAKENVKNNSSGTVAKQTTIKTAIKGADITLAATTMEQLLAKKEICRHVTKQCVNSNKRDEVWTLFLRNAAPALKSAEELAEQKLRMECIPSAVSCFQSACKANFGDGDSYDMCLSNPKTYKSLCKVQLEPCLAATGGSFDEPDKSSLWDGLTAALNAMKVDACTKEIRECLTSEDTCGSDYSGCIGLSTEHIVDLCPTGKLTACMTENKNDETTIKNYIKDIAKGLELQIDNNMLLTCEKALDDAMVKYCGAKDSCPNASVSATSLKELMAVAMCKVDGTTDTHKNLKSRKEKIAELKALLKGIKPADVTSMPNCNIDPYAFEREDLLTGNVLVQILGPDLASLDWKPGTTDITTTTEDDKETTTKTISPGKYESGDTELANLLNTVVERYYAMITADQKVDFCVNGREYQNMQGGKNSTSIQNQRYQNLTVNTKQVIAFDVLSRLWDDYDDIVQKMNEDEVPTMEQKLSDRINEIVAVDAETIIARNQVWCQKKEDRRSEPNINGCKKKYSDTMASYDAVENVCTLTVTDYKRNGCGAAFKFKEDKQNIIKIPMPSINRSVLVDKSHLDGLSGFSVTTMGTYK